MTEERLRQRQKERGEKERIKTMHDSIYPCMSHMIYMYENIKENPLS